MVPGLPRLKAPDTDVAPVQSVYVTGARLYGCKPSVPQSIHDVCTLPRRCSSRTIQRLWEVTF